MTIDDKIRDERLQYNIDREAEKYQQVKKYYPVIIIE